MTNICDGLEESYHLRVVHRPGPRGYYDEEESYFTVYLGDVQIRGPLEQDQARFTL